MFRVTGSLGGTFSWLPHKGSLDSESGKIYSDSLVRGRASDMAKSMDIGKSDDLGP